MFSHNLEQVIGGCYKEAREKRHEFMTVEHLLLWLLKDDDVARFVKALGADTEKISESLRKAIEASVNRLPQDSDKDTQPTLGFQRVLQRAVYHVQSNGKEEVTPLNCLVAVFGEKDSHAAYFLRENKIERLDAVNYVSHGILRTQDETAQSKIEKIAETPPVVKPVAASKSPKLRLFISYSHVDSSCLDRLLVHLTPLQRQDKIDPWSDKRIRPGDKWKKEIAKNVNEAAVAILLVSADFLASTFIVENELPPLLISAESNGTRILPVIVKPCGFHRDEILSSFQCVNDPKAPLLGLSSIDQEHLYDEIANQVYEEMKLRSTFAASS